jgi:glycolate oxidase FAD binding subunit
VIGIRLVDGEGRAIRSGGRVVKNAAGFLLHHGVVGSWGRFGVLTEVTLKVFPAPEARRTVALACGSVERAFEAAQQVESLRMDCESIEFDEQGALEMTVAGRAAVIDARAERLASALETFVTGGLPVFGGEAGLRTIGKPANSRPVPVENVVRVAGLAKSWPTLQPLISHAHFMCAGAVAWLTTADLPRLGHALSDAQLTGQVIRGAAAGQRIGHVITSEFETRVRRVLDPYGRFHAAPDSD